MNIKAHWIFFILIVVFSWMFDKLGSWDLWTSDFQIIVSILSPHSIRIYASLDIK